MHRTDTDEEECLVALSAALGTRVAVEQNGLGRGAGGREPRPGDEAFSVSDSDRARVVADVGAFRLRIDVPDHKVVPGVPQGIDEGWLDTVALVVASFRAGVSVTSAAAAAGESALSVERQLGRDEAVARYSMSLEHAIDDYIRTHSDGRLQRYLAEHPIHRDAGRLADGDRIRGLKDLMISILAVATRVAAGAGTNVPVAFGISDYFIREFERAHTEEELERALLRSLRALADSVTTARHLGRSALVRAAEEWILTHLDTAVRPAEVAAALGVRRDYLAARFRRETGLTLAEYALSSKVDEAKTILTHTDLPMSELCRRLGFYDQSHLIRVFRRFAHDTPHRYRVRTRPRRR